jgi:hypothetical protein
MRCLRLGSTTVLLLQALPPCKFGS